MNGPRVRRGIRYGMASALLCVASAVALAAAFPATVRIPPRQPAQGGPPRSLPAAAFSHRSHQALGCYGCHPSVFPQAPLGFTHEDMRQGRYCARCHQGQVAFAVEGAACARCHVPIH